MRSLERQGEGIRDEDKDFEDEVEEEDGEELEEGGLNNVEYVSDLGDEVESDIEELQKWLDGDGATERALEGSESASWDEDQEEDDGDEEDGLSNEQDFTTKTQRGPKRKRPSALSRPRKIPKSRKGQKVEIEYEEETVTPARAVLHA